MNYHQIQAAIAEIPPCPQWVRNAALRAIADCIDYTDPAALAVVVGRSLTAEEHTEVIGRCDVGIQHTSEVLGDLGLIRRSDPPTNAHRSQKSAP